MKIIADSNIWIEFFNKPKSDIGNQFEVLLKNGDVQITGLIIAELLQGAASQKEINTILGLKEHLPFIETTEEIWAQAGILSNQLRKKGVVIPLSDILLAVLARENDCYIFTRDNHFKQIPGLNLL
jgi:predicted nucleic acid-binding protein